ncbi:MAG: J domain-containing protein [SAR324 cluster bacterium]|nr:J domain-containing protein [SAR324 cluster bacterium]
MQLTDYYKLLQITHDVSADEIRKAFRREAKKYHPDLYQGHDQNEMRRRQKHFVLLTQAYEVLSDPRSRKEYDSKWQVVYGQKTKTTQQKTYTNTSHSWDKSGGNSFRKTGPAQFTPEEEESLEDILEDVEELLKKFGLNLKDPLDLLVNWAKHFFQMFVDAWNDDGSPRENASSSTKQETTGHSMFQDIEEELQRMKQTYQGQQNNRSQGFQNSEIERELNELKRKHKK